MIDFLLFVESLECYDLLLPHKDILVILVMLCVGSYVHVEQHWSFVYIFTELLMIWMSPPID